MRSNIRLRKKATRIIAFWDFQHCRFGYVYLTALVVIASQGSRVPDASKSAVIRQAGELQLRRSVGILETPGITPGRTLPWLDRHLNRPSIQCLYNTLHINSAPVRARGLCRECAPPYPQRDRKRRLNGAVCRNHRIKRLVPCRCLDGHVKEPCEMSMALGARP